MDELKFLHFDLDAFFATVEEIDNPSLKGKPMVVGGRSGRGIITTANYEARKYGLHSAMPIFQGKRLCPHIIIVPTRKDRYREVSRKVFRILENYSDRIEKKSIDEGCMDISHRKEKPDDIARAIQKDVLENTGCTLSIGISYTMSLAKIASEWQKPAGLFIITKDMMPDVLRPLPITAISGIGPKTAKRFYNLGIRSIDDLLRLSKEALEQHFGKHGISIYKKIRGFDQEDLDLTRERKSLGTEETFEKDIQNKNQLYSFLDRYAAELARDLKKKGLIGKTIQLKLKYSDFNTITRSYSLEEYTDNVHHIRRIAYYLLERIDIPKPVRLLGLTMANLTENRYRQLEFLQKNIYKNDRKPSR